MRRGLLSPFLCLQPKPTHCPRDVCKAGAPPGTLPAALDALTWPGLHARGFEGDETETVQDEKQVCSSLRPKWILTGPGSEEAEVPPVS